MAMQIVWDKSRLTMQNYILAEVPIKYMVQSIVKYKFGLIWMGPWVFGLQVKCFYLHVQCMYILQTHTHTKFIFLGYPATVEQIFYHVIM